MIELIRIVEHQAELYSYRATQNKNRALQLELLIEMTKPKNNYTDWHPLIATPFRYSPPHTEARFRPAYGKNVFYGSLIEETALYEHAFHFMKQRIHLKIKTDMGMRTVFSVDANEHDATYIKNNVEYLALMDKHNYQPSQQYILNNPNETCIIYPSVRDPNNGENAAILTIERLEKNPKWESSIKFFYDNDQQQLSWLDYRLYIQWKQVL